ncbi:MAG: hypothetical protein IJF59_02400 [Clostridia bacterium]|nr:hypothetical protein [Clostridia bacterium]MBQ3077054.1 hypothetical protein [Clostridia bacterium]
MREQQQASREVRSQSKDQARELSAPSRQQAARLPARQWAQLLSSGAGLTDLSPELLRQLAEAVGNSSLVDLLRQGGGDLPLVRLPENLLSGLFGQEQDVNHITTAPPLLCPFPGWPEPSARFRLQPVKAGRLRDRG